jgi:hypothetical protein
MTTSSISVIAPPGLALARLGFVRSVLVESAPFYRTFSSSYSIATHPYHSEPEKDWRRKSIGLTTKKKSAKFPILAVV